MPEFDSLKHFKGTRSVKGNLVFWDISDIIENKCCISGIMLASVSFWPLLIIESVARVSQQVLFPHDLLVKQVER